MISLFLGWALIGIPDFVIGQQSTNPELSTTEIAKRLSPAAITIIVLGVNNDTLAQGSGFIVKSDGTIVTNWHVMAGAHSAIVTLSNGEQYNRISFLDGDSTTDIAILKFPGYDLPITPTTSTIPLAGSKVVVIGSPLGLPQTVSEGIVSAVRMVNGKQVVQVSAPISSGSSGGPVIDDKGRVFAIATASIERGQNLNFVVPIKYAMGLVKTNRSEIPLHQVFGNQREGSASSSELASIFLRPTQKISRDITGVYRTVSVYSRIDSLGFWPNGTHYFGLMILGHHNGWIACGEIDEPEDALSQTGYVCSIWDLICDSTGRLAFEFAGLTFDGFQSDTGFYATGLGHLTSDSIAVTENLVAWRVAAPLSNPIGLYDVSARTFCYHSSNYKDYDWVGDKVDWEGEATIIVLRDSIYISVYLRNEFGGSTGGLFRGPLMAGRSFALQSYDNGLSIEGTVGTGHIHADWVDRRDGGLYYKGTMEGNHR